MTDTDSTAQPDKTPATQPGDRPPAEPTAPEATPEAPPAARPEPMPEATADPPADLTAEPGPPTGTGAGGSDAPRTLIGAQDSAAINASLAALAAGTVRLAP